MPPLVSIGIPVFNAEKTLPAALHSLFQQTFTDYEVVISDNASWDRTAEICKTAAGRRGNVKYIRSHMNYGAFWNFQQVLAQARGKYFMWLASDDELSEKFLEYNVATMERMGSCTVASAGWNYHPHPLYRNKEIRFACRGDKCQRLLALLDNIYDSHGIFYSLMRTEVIRSFPFPTAGFPAWDWAVDAHLAAYGQIERAEGAQIIFGQSGMSLQKGGWNLFLSNSFDRILPTSRFSIFMIKKLGDMPRPQQVKILVKLIKLNQRVWQELRNSKRHGQG